MCLLCDSQSCGMPCDLNQPGQAAGAENLSARLESTVRVLGAKSSNYL